ncbi:MAG: PorT family protein [Muribaculaceae bacterium]|nr:PorT family protein [Muribaculaceae bacterium]
MKKITLLIAAMLLATAAATAQTTSRWGITAGANFNEVHFKQTDIVPSKRAWGPQVGVTGEMNFSGIGFGVEGSLLYTLKQGKVNYGERTIWSSVGAGNETVSMHYLDVPLHLKFKWRRMGGLESTIMPMLYVGPQFSFIVGASNKNLNSYPPVNVYLDMGAGVELIERLQLRAGYNFSIGQSFHTKLLDDNVAKNRTWYVSATWFLK